MRRSQGERFMSLEERLAELRASSLHDVRGIWADLFGRAPPSVSKLLLMHSIAYRMQEELFGGLPNRQIAQLHRSAARFRRTGTASIPDPVRITPGTHLVREWHGKTHHVSVEADCYIFN